MGMDLRNSTGTLRVGLDTWMDYLLLAQAAGWQPAGTEQPTYWNDPEWGFKDIEVWNGTYFANDGQVVTAEDASALADALAGVLDDIPDGKPLNLPSILRCDDPNYDELPRIIERQVGYKHYLQEFIDYCRKGDFTIR